MRSSFNDLWSGLFCLCRVHSREILSRLCLCRCPEDGRDRHEDAKEETLLRDEEEDEEAVIKIGRRDIHDHRRGGRRVVGRRRDGRLFCRPGGLRPFHSAPRRP